MKPLIFFIIVLLNTVSLWGQVKTSGDNSPAIIAQNFSAMYGVRADAVEAILWIYKAEGYDVDRRKRATEQIMREYAQSPEKQQKTDLLSDATRHKLGISDAPQIATALEWDLFARSHYLSTTGKNSPAVMTQGDVNIWYGIPPKALRALAAQLEKNKTDLSNFETELADQVKKYKELKTELETYGSKEEIYKKAEILFEEGRLEEAEQLIEADYRVSKKRQAYKGYVFGKAKELLLKYEVAAEGYRDAVFMDNTNSTYHLYYANNENILAHYDVAIMHWGIALGMDSLKSGTEERVATLNNNLGSAWHTRGDYDKAIEYYKKALQINVMVFEENHPNVAINYNNLGASCIAKGDYDNAIEYCEKALQIDEMFLGENHPYVARDYNNLGSAWHSKEAYDKAIEYYEKALQIDEMFLGENHPYVARDFNNFGSAWHSRGDYDKAIEYYEKSLQINVKIFGENHPNVASNYCNLGSAWNSKGDYDKAIVHQEKALQIDVKIFGENHPNIASTYNNLGSAWNSKGDYDKAIGHYTQALQIDINVFGENHPNVARDYNNLGSAWNSKGDYDKATGYYEKALKIDVNIFGENHPTIAMYYNNFGLVWASKGEHDKAIGYYEKALQIDAKGLRENQTNIAFVYNNLGEAWASKQDFDKAIKYYEKSLQIAAKAFGENHPTIARYYNNFGTAWNSKGDYDKAIGYFNNALRIDVKIFGENHLNVAIDYNNLGSAWDSKAEYDKAIGYYEKALQILLNAFGEKHPKVATIYNNLGEAFRKKGEHDQSIGYFEKSQKIWNLFFEPTHLMQRTTAYNLSLATNSRGMELANEKNYREALRYFEKSLQNAQMAEHEVLSLTCLSNIGSMHKMSQEYTTALQTLDIGLEKAAKINAQIDKTIIEEGLTPEMLAKPEVQLKISEMKNSALIRRMQYHKVGCLKGLKHDKKAEKLSRELWQDCIKANDTRTLEDLKKEGYDFGGN